MAHLKLRDDEVDALRDELSRIIDYFDQLGLLDTEGVEPCAPAAMTMSTLRSDEPQPGFSQQQTLANASETRDGWFRVPPVLDAEAGT